MEDILIAFPDRETFDRFWEENYVPVTYEDVKEAFEEFVTSAEGHIYLSDYEAGGCISKADFKENLTEDAMFEIYQEAQMSGMKENDTAQTFHDTYNRLYDEFLDRLFEENLDHQSK